MVITEHGPQITQINADYKSDDEGRKTPRLNTLEGDPVQLGREDGSADYPGTICRSYGAPMAGCPLRYHRRRLHGLMGKGGRTEQGMGIREKKPVEILVVDDDKEVADVLVEWLSKKGYQATAA